MKIYLHLNIKYLRGLKNLTQTQLSEKLDKTHTVVGAYEKNKIVPPLDVLLKICEIFKVPVEDILFKDLSREDYEMVQEEPREEGILKDKLIKLMEEKIGQYEREIKENAPELAKKLKLDT